MKYRDFIAELFVYAQEKGIALCLAHQGIRNADTGEIEILVGKNDQRIVDAFLRDRPGLKKTGIFPMADGITIYIYGIENGTLSAASVRCTCSLTVDGIDYLDIDHVLKRAVPDEKGVKTPNDIDQAIILLMTHGLKHKGTMRRSHLAFIQNVAREHPTAFSNALVNLLGPHAALDMLERIENGQFAKSFWTRMSSALKAQSWQWRGGLTLLDRFSYRVRQIAYLLGNRPVQLAFYGANAAMRQETAQSVAKNLEGIADDIRVSSLAPSWPWNKEMAKKEQEASLSFFAKIMLWGRCWIAYLWPYPRATLFVYDAYLPAAFLKDFSLLRKIFPPVRASVLVEDQSPLYRTFIKETTAPIILSDMPIGRLASIATAHCVQAMEDKEGSAYGRV